MRFWRIRSFNASNSAIEHLKVARVELFLRFAVIFLISLVILLIPLLLFKEPPMCRYSWISVENWGWPPLFFSEKPLFPPISHRKNAGKFFWYWCRKKRTPSENQISPKEKQRCCNVFCFKMEAIVHQNLPPERSEKKVEKSSFIQETRDRYSVPSSSTVFVGLKIVRQLYLLFFLFWLTLLVFLYVLSLFHIFPSLNLVV